MPSPPVPLQSLGEPSSSSPSSNRSHAAPSQPTRIQPRRNSHSSAERLTTENKLNRQHAQKRKRSSSKKRSKGKRGGGKKAKTTAGKENQDEKEVIAIATARPITTVDVRVQDQDIPDAAAITTSTS